MTALLSGVDLARAVLKAKDRYELLSLGSTEPIRVGDDGFLNVEDEDVRRVYIKMSVKIHPDKLREFPEATKAFQALVRAYELCCKPDLREDESDDSRSGGDESDDEEEEEAGDDESDDDDEAAAPEEVEEEAAAPAAPRARAKAPTSYAEVDSDEDLDEDSDEDEAPKKRAPKRAPKAKAGKQPPRKKKPPTAKKKKAPRQRRRRSTAANTRGDAAERRTGVSCPRCSSGWGDHLRGEGQEGLYTEFMRGARRVSCTSCLFEFGCLSAGHACPDCSAPFEYRPQRFDAAFVCSRKSCGATFSVARFALSRAAKAGEADREADESRKRKAEAASRARAERAEKLRDDDDDEAALLELGAFIVSEECPRCGKLFTSGHKKHLATCRVATKPAGKLKGAWLVGSTSSRDGDYVAKPRKPAAAAKKATVSKAKKPAAAKPASKKPAARKPKKAADSDESDDDFLASDSDFDAAPRKKRPKKAAKAAKPKASKPKASKPKAAKAPVKKKIKKSDWSDSDSSFADY